jgi:hypothetical protein
MKRFVLGLVLAGALVPAVALATVSWPTRLSEEGTGIASRNTAACGGIPNGCVHAKGTVRGQPITGDFTLAYTADWSKTTKAGKCAKAGGTIELIAKNPANSITLTDTGRLCKAASGTFTYAGAYTLSLGTGIYANTGVSSGRSGFTVSAKGKIHVLYRGTFKPIERPPA